MVSLCPFRILFFLDKWFLHLRSERLVKQNRVDCHGRWKEDVCQQQKCEYMLLSWSVLQNTVNLEINQVCFVPCLRDSWIFLMAWDGLTKEYRRWWLKILWYLCAHVLNLHASVYQFAWKSHLTLKWILFVVVGYFMYLFRSLVAGFSYQDVALFWSAFKTIHSGLLASE